MNKPLDTNKEMQAVFGDQIVFRLDLDGNILFVNEAGERLTGYSAVELARLSILDLLPGRSAADLRAMANRSIRRRFGTVFEVAVTTRDRRQIQVEVSIDFIRRTDRKLELRGIAVAKHDAACSRLRPQCLDIRFQFRASKAAERSVTSGVVDRGARTASRLHFHPPLTKSRTRSINVGNSPSVKNESAGSR